MSDKLKKKIYIFICVLFSISFLYGVFNIYQYTYKLEKDKKATNLVYTNYSNIEYLVHINENDFILDETLSTKDSYISSLTDDIELQMSYEFMTDEIMDLNTKYDVKAYIQAYYNESPVEKYNNPLIWEKEIVLVPNKEQTLINEKHYLINENIKLNWKDLINEINEFKLTFSLPVISKIEVKLDLNLEGNNENYTFKENPELGVSIPVSELVFNVNKNFVEKEEKTVEKVIENKDYNNNIKVILYSSIALLSALPILYCLYLLNSLKQKDLFKIEIDKIKKNYDEIVVETNNMIKITGLRPIAITTFNELLNLAESINQPIILFEHKNYAYFYIIQDNIIYNYILDRKKFKEENKSETKKETSKPKKEEKKPTKTTTKKTSAKKTTKKTSAKKTSAKKTSKTKKS